MLVGKGLFFIFSFICSLMNAVMFYAFLKKAAGCSRESIG